MELWLWPWSVMVSRSSLDVGVEDAPESAASDGGEDPVAVEGIPSWAGAPSLSSHAEVIDPPPSRTQVERLPYLSARLEVSVAANKLVIWLETPPNTLS